MTASPQPSEAPTSIALARVNVGAPSLLARADGTDVWSGIAKHPVPAGTTLWCSTVNLGGDGQADLSVHGGPDKAVYAYPSEHLGPWRDELGEELGDAPFGENLSTVGATEDDTCIGDLWAWGGATLEVCQPRWPCYKLALYRRRPDIQKLMRGSGRTGWYLRVLEPGAVTTDDDIAVVHRDPDRLSVMDAHLAMGDRHLEEPDRLRALADHERLSEEWRGPLRERLAR
jgi:MOSC domain-containing protein YiiM